MTTTSIARVAALAFLLGVLAICAGGPADAHAAKTRACGSLSTPSGAAANIRATGTTCRSARELIRSAHRRGRGLCCVAPSSFNVRSYRCTPRNGFPMRYRCTTKGTPKRTVTWTPGEIGA